MGSVQPHSGDSQDIRWIDGRPAPSPGSPPDGHTLRLALDAWAETTDIARHLSYDHHWSVWWPMRFALHRELLQIVPRLRSAQALLEKEPPKLLRLHDPPDDAWATAFRIVCGPDTRVVTIRPRASALRKALDPAAFKRVWTRWRRARATRIRLALHEGQEKPGVLVMMRDRVWNGKEDAELGKVAQRLRDQGLRVITMSHWFASIDKLALAYATRPKDHLFADALYYDLIRRASRPYPEPPEMDAPLLVEGFDLTPWIRDRILRYLGREYAEQVAAVEAFRLLAKRLNLAGAVLTDENGRNRATKVALQLEGVPVIAVQHGLIHNDHMAYIMPTGTAPDSIPLADRTCVYGEHYRELLTAHSAYPPQRVAVTGPPLRDRHPASPAESSALRVRALGDRDQDRLLLFTSQHWYRDWLAEPLLRSLAKSDKRYVLAIRPHPDEARDGFWETMAEQYSVADRVVDAGVESLDAWIAACDAHVSGSSTVIAEAALLNTPSILVGVSMLGDWLDAIPAGIAVDLGQFDSMGDAADHWLDSGQMDQFEIAAKAFCARHFDIVNGPCVGRISECVMSCIQSASRKYF